MILTIPCLFLSTAAARRVHQLHRDMQRTHYSFKYSTGHFHSRSQMSNERNLPSVKSPITMPSNTTPTSVDPVMLYSSRPTSARGDESPYDDPAVSSPPTFGALSTSPMRSEAWEALGSNEEDVGLDPPRQMEGMMLSCKLHLLHRIWYKVLRLTMDYQQRRGLRHFQNPISRRPSGGSFCSKCRDSRRMIPA